MHIEHDRYITMKMNAKKIANEIYKEREKIENKQRERENDAYQTEKLYIYLYIYSFNDVHRLDDMCTLSMIHIHTHRYYIP